METKKKYKQRFIWKPEQEDILFQVWAEKEEDLRGPRKNMEVFREIAEALQYHGIDLTEEEIKSKINNLRQKYRKEKEAMTDTGIPSEWEGFDKVHKIVSGYDNSQYSSMKAEEESFPERDFAVNIKVESSGMDYEDVATAAASPASAFPALELSPTPSVASSSNRARSRHKRANLGDVLMVMNKTHDKMEAILENIEKTNAELLVLERKKLKLLKEQTEDGKELKEGILKMLGKISNSLSKRTN